MDKKPIKRHENILKLSRDHHASLLFCWKLRQGIKQHASAKRMIKYAQYFLKAHFNPHFKEEEEILFSPLKDKAVQKAIDDHKRIKMLINELSSGSTENQHEQLFVLADLVDEHVRYEERILFPHLEEKLSEEQLENIGKQISGEPLKDNFKDPFWIKSTSL